jgi:hypothetical protein
LADFGQTILSKPEFNSIYDRTVFGQADMIFDLNRDLLPDLHFTLSNDLSSIIGMDSLALYPLNKPGTGFSTIRIPEPVVALALAPLLMLRRRTA